MWARLIAHFIDGALTFAFGLAAVLLGFGPASRSADDSSVNLVALVAEVALVAYFVVTTTLYGRTLGKRILRLRVVMLDTRTLPTWTASALRSLPVLIGLAPFIGDAGAWIALIVVIVCYGLTVIDPLRRGLHDHLAGTIVVDEG